MEYLTPSETRIYESTLASARTRRAKRGTCKIYSRRFGPRSLRAKDGPYVALTEATFAAAPDWQKDKFCGSPVSPNIMTTANTQKNEAAINESGDAVKILGKYAKDLVGFNLTTAENVPNVGLPVSAFNLCREGYPFTQKDPPSGNKERQGPPPLDSENSNKAGNVSNIGGNSGSDNKNIAKKQENKDKDSEWLSRDLLGSAAKGAMVGLLVGSLFRTGRAHRRTDYRRRGVLRPDEAHERKEAARVSSAQGGGGGLSRLVLHPPRQHPRPDRNARVRHVEHGPVMDVQKIHDEAQRYAVVKVSHRAGRDEQGPHCSQTSSFGQRRRRT